MSRFAVLWGIAAALLAPGVRNVSSTPFLFWACRYAAHRGFRITATTNGRHNRGSKHYRGLALDVSLRGHTALELARFAAGLPAWGWRLRDESRRPAGQAVWGGPHWHIEAEGEAWQRRAYRAAGLPQRGRWPRQTRRHRRAR